MVRSTHVCQDRRLGGIIGRTQNLLLHRHLSDGTQVTRLGSTRHTAPVDELAGKDTDDRQATKRPYRPDDPVSRDG